MRRHKYALSFRSTLYRHLNIAHQLSIQSHCLTIHSNAVRPLEFFHYRIHFSHNIFAVGLHSADSYHWIWYRWAAPTPATSLTLAAMLPPPLIYLASETTLNRWPASTSLCSQAYIVGNHLPIWTSLTNLYYGILKDTLLFYLQNLR